MSQKSTETPNPNDVLEEKGLFAYHEFVAGDGRKFSARIEMKDKKQADGSILRTPKIVSVSLVKEDDKDA